MRGKLGVWIVAIIASFVLLIFFLSQLNFSGNRIYWYDFYRHHEREPYDLLVINELLKDYFPGKKFSESERPVKEWLPVDSTRNSCYLFIGHTLFLSYDDQLRLYEFVRKGNEAFIASNEFPYELVNFFFEMEDYYDDSEMDAVIDSIVSMNFLHPQLRKSSGYEFPYVFNWDKHLNRWNYFIDSLLDRGSMPVVRLGTIDEVAVNFIKIPYGKGAFYLYTNPIVFTNYQLKEESHVVYAENIFSHLRPADIYWDEFSKIPQYSYGADVGGTNTPLRYILSQPALKWAWYILLAVAALFLIFKTKRTQQIIPVLEQNTNTSLEYIQTVARLYKLQNDHKSLALQKMKLLLGFIRHRYGLQIKSLDEEWMRKLSEKSQVSESRLRKILEEYKTITNMDDITPEQLEEFHHQLDIFYRQCK